MKGDYRDRSWDVCILGLNFPPELTGIAPYTGELARELQANGLRVNVHATHPHYPEWKIYRSHGGWKTRENFYDVQVDRYLHYVPRSPRGLRRLISELSFGIRLVFARLGRPLVFIAVSPSLFSTALAVARIKVSRPTTPLIIWVQDLYTLGVTETGEGSNLIARVIQRVESRTLRAADNVVVIHQRFADYVVKQFRLDPSKVEVIRNWTHVSTPALADPIEARARLGWPEGVLLAVHTGNMGIKQGLDNIVEAARLADQRSSPIHFILVGHGSERQRLERLADGITRIAFVDPLDEQDYPLALAAADVLLVNERPGVASMAVPSKLTSYFLAGKPIVAATDPHGITAAEIGSSNAGVIVAADRPEELLGRIFELCADPGTAAKLGNNGRQYQQEVLGKGTAIGYWSNLLQAYRLIDQT